MRLVCQLHKLFVAFSKVLVSVESFTGEGIFDFVEDIAHLLCSGYVNHELVGI